MIDVPRTLMWSAWYIKLGTSRHNVVYLDYATCQDTPDEWIDRVMAALHPGQPVWHAFMVRTVYRGMVGDHVFDEGGVYCGIL